MSASAVAVAARGKGTWNAMRRAAAIGTHYGLGPRRMEDRLATVLAVADRCGCRATLPVVASVAERYPEVIARYWARGLEFAVHGLYHVDHTDLAKVDQIDQLERAKQALEGAGTLVAGFRAPYLRANEATIEAVRRTGFEYDASQAFHWPLDTAAGGGGGRTTGAYERALDFYDARSAGAHPVLPWLESGIVRLPYCLPDDEAVVDRLELTPTRIAALWRGILDRTHERGELFTLAVHPERIVECAAAMADVLAAARTVRPPVWVARLDEIARWWRDRAVSIVSVREDRPGWLRVAVLGPDGLTMLARHLDVPGAEPWFGADALVPATEVEIPALPRPFVGVRPAAPASLVTFLREQGYIVERSGSPRLYGSFVERDRFSWADRRPLLAELEDSAVPLLRLGRWPYGARSALSVTGDVDALTIGDYARRLLGH
jgi:peptidoglycan/xylan/chitin deacetylase (PgdA/CDA1 family)